MMPLWGRDCPLPALAALTCLSPAGDGPVCSQLALLSSFFCEPAWLCLMAFRGIVIPQSELLSQVSSLRLPLGHSVRVLILSNAAHTSLPALASGRCGHLRCFSTGNYHSAHNLWVLIMFFSSQLCCPLRFQGSPQTLQ